MSAGELEHEWAGTPGRLIRERYRRAAEHAKNRGKMPCLIINDLDAGIGIQANVQRTVRAACTAYVVALCALNDQCLMHPDQSTACSITFVSQLSSDEQLQARVLCEALGPLGCVGRNTGVLAMLRR